MKLEQSLKLVGTGLALLGFAFGAYQWFDKKERELKAPFNAARLEIYLETATVAATLATSDQPEELAEARRRFDVLFFGRLHLVEDRQVVLGMGEFRQCLEDPACAAGDTGGLKTASLRLSKVLRASIDETWNLKTSASLN